ncbi:protein kinase [Streptomyces sp. NPDC095817]|uniref:serine/threonine-protein kinase n=1 Tax=Streptomyces sp. NPDC095817 TaxID=3155082 RepID=UPI003328C110
MRVRDSARAAVARCSADVLSGRYRLDGLLGSGGAADVYRGFDLRLKRSVAVKVFKPDSGFAVEQSSHGEAVILARLHHPGLVTAYDAGRHKEHAYLVMQLIEGATLKRRIAQGLLPSTETACLGSCLAHALTHAHEANIVHRDVKPSNILLDAAQRPYLTDFGISRLLNTTTHTATGTLIGTAAYLSPEQVLGQPVGRAADIYALGLVLLEYLTGRLEYGGVPLEAAIARLHREPVIPDSAPPQLADVLRAMTALDENERPTAPECAAVLTEIAEEVRPKTGPSKHAVSPALDIERSSIAGDRTHRSLALDTDETPARTAAAKRRSLTVGAIVALAAVMATALVISGNSTSQGSDPSSTKSTSVPTSAQKKDATTATQNSQADHSNDGTRKDVEPERGARPSADRPEPAADSDTVSATTARPTSSSAGAPGATGHAEKDKTPPRPPDPARKAAKGPKHKKAKAGKGP